MAAPAAGPADVPMSRPVRTGGVQCGIVVAARAPVVAGAVQQVGALDPCYVVARMALQLLVEQLAVLAPRLPAQGAGRNATAAGPASVYTPGVALSSAACAAGGRHASNRSSRSTELDRTDPLPGNGARTVRQTSSTHGAPPDDLQSRDEERCTSEEQPSRPGGGARRRTRFVRRSASKRPARGLQSVGASPWGSANDLWRLYANWNRAVDGA